MTTEYTKKKFTWIVLFNITFKVYLKTTVDGKVYTLDFSEHFLGSRGLKYVC